MNDKNYTDQDLKNLEAKKLEAEIENMKQQHETQRIKEKYSYRKFVIGTVMIGLLSVAANVYIVKFNSKQEIKLEGLKDCFALRQGIYNKGRENLTVDMIDQLINCFPEDEEAYLAIKEAVEENSESKADEESVEYSLNQVEFTQKADLMTFYTLKEKEQLSVLKPEELEKFNELDQDKELKKTVERMDSEVSDDLKDIERRKKIVLQKEITYTDLIDKNITPSQNPENVQDTISWVKPGFYRDHDKIRIYLSKLEGRQASGTVYVQGLMPDTIDFKIPMGEVFEFSENGHNYKLSYMENGKAGYNPFDKAMYYLLKKVKK